MNEGKWQHLCLGQVGLQSRTLCSPRQQHFPVSGVSPTPSRGLALSQPAFCLDCCKQQFHHFLQKHNFPLLSPCPLNTPVLPQPTRWCWSCTVFINPLFQTAPQWQSASSAAGVLWQVGVTPVPRDIPLLFKASAWAGFCRDEFHCFSSGLVCYKERVPCKGTPQTSLRCFLQLTDSTSMFHPFMRRWSTDPWG